MKTPREAITDAELAVLKLLWESPQRTARQITQTLYDEPTSGSLGAVQKLLQRLERKGYCERNRDGYVHTFSAGVSQDALAGGLLEVLAGKIADGSLAPFISHLVKARRLSKKEKEQLRRLLGE